MDIVAKAGAGHKWTRVCMLVVFPLAVSPLTFAQTFPTSPDAAAKVIELTGQVSVLRDNGPWVLNLGDLVQVKQVIRTGPDGYAKLQVSDGSTFEVYPSSTVVFRQNPTNWRDLLDIWVGKIKIHIQKIGGHENPNTIHTPSAIISVRGTTFDVSVDGDEENTIVTVEEGIVDVRHATRGGNIRTLHEGETIEVLKSQPIARSVIDKGAIFQRMLRAMTDALQTMQTAGRSSGGVTGGGGPTLSGQTPPPPPPPPLPQPQTATGERS
jgi:hypothetical protein